MTIFGLWFLLFIAHILLFYFFFSYYWVSEYNVSFSMQDNSNETLLQRPEIAPYKCVISHNHQCCL